MSELTFLPYLRRGLAAAITKRDALSGSVGLPATVEVSVTVEARRVARPVELLGAGAVTNLGPAQVVRSEPRPGSTDVEPNYFALCELVAPDMPWLMTPAAPASAGRLRPWLVLVVVRRQDGVTIAAPGTTELAVLTIDEPASPAGELPDLADSWAWVHVQSSVPEPDIAATVEAGGAGVVARVLSPRKLDPETAYYACLVPAFDAGVQRGLGAAPDAAAPIGPAWDLATLAERIDLPVYHWWEFTTGAAGDFEDLCRRLKPDSEEAVMGLHAMDVGDPGLVPSAGRVLVDMEGALMTLDAAPRPWPESHRDSFIEAMEPLLDAAIAAPVVAVADPAEYDPLVDDPVFTPPAYGAAAAGVTELPGEGWVRGVNVNPVQRSMAGLGAAVVRANQEALVAAAWDQAGDLRAASAALNQACLAAEIGESWARRVRALPDADVLQATRVLHPLLDHGAANVLTSVRDSGVPAGVFTAAYARQTRPGTTLWRDWRRRTSDTARLAADVAGTMLTAARADASDEARPALAFAQYVMPAGTQTSDPTLRSLSSIELSRPPRSSRTAPRRARLAESGEPGGPGDIDDIDDIPIEDFPTFSLTPAGAVRAGLVPLDAVRASAVARIPALDSVLAPGALPSTLHIAPTFEDALYWDVLGLGASWLVPGLEQLGANRVRLLAVNAQFVGACLIGANTEIVHELRWRDYPIEPTATCFHRFFEYVADPARVDIGELSCWKTGKTIIENMGLAEDTTMTAIVVRGDVVRRYPTAHWFLQPARPDGEGGWEATPGEVVELSFVGSLDATTGVYGFDLAPEDVRGNRTQDVGGYFFGIEEQLGAPRFGLDVAKPAHFDKTPKAWDKASWGHLVSSQEDLDALTHARATGLGLDGVEIDGTTWGHNSAHVARATWQRPFRMLMHADLLI